MYEKITESLLSSAPVLIALIAYFIRLEIALAKLQNDMTWIKRSTPLRAARYPTAEQKGG